MRAEGMGDDSMISDKKVNIFPLDANYGALLLRSSGGRLQKFCATVQWEPRFAVP